MKSIMLFKQDFLNGIAEGRITLAFRRWKRPSVKAGGMLRTPIGVLSISSVNPITEAEIRETDAKRAGFNSRLELLESLDGRDGRLFRISFERAGDDPRIALRENSDLTAADAEELRKRLERLDAHSKVGPWTMLILRLIARHPERRAAELAARSSFEKEWLKRNIRKLKNLGLTESLTVGYRLSPRGTMWLKMIPIDGESQF